jgi:hypothetical protein
MRGENGMGIVLNNTGCPTLLCTNAIKGHSPNASDGRIYPLIVGWTDDKPPREIVTN